MGTPLEIFRNCDALIWIFRNLLQYMFIQFVKVGGLAIDAHNVALLGVQNAFPKFWLESQVSVNLSGKLC